MHLIQGDIIREFVTSGLVWNFFSVYNIHYISEISYSFVYVLSGFVRVLQLDPFKPRIG